MIRSEQKDAVIELAAIIGEAIARAYLDCTESISNRREDKSDDNGD